MIPQLINLIANSDPDYDLVAFERYTGPCLSLLKSMLDKDPSRRPSASECLEHEWFKEPEQLPVQGFLEIPSSKAGACFRSYTFGRSLIESLINDGLDFIETTNLLDQLRELALKERASFAPTNVSLVKRIKLNLSISLQDD